MLGEGILEVGMAFQFPEVTAKGYVLVDADLLIREEHDHVLEQQPFDLVDQIGIRRGKCYAANYCANRAC